jgi:hypothetical protein
MKASMARSRRVKSLPIRQPVRWQIHRLERDVIDWTDGIRFQGSIKCEPHPIDSNFLGEAKRRAALI